MSTTPPYPGHELQQRREALGMTPWDASRKVRIPAAYIEALEKGDFDALPAPCYIVGFLHAYCAFLGTKPERYVDCFCARKPFAERAPRPLVPRRRRPSTWKSDLLTWAAICAFILLGWFTYSAVVHPKGEFKANRVEADMLVIPEEASTPGEPEM